MKWIFNEKQRIRRICDKCGGRLKISNISRPRAQCPKCGWRFIITDSPMPIILKNKEEKLEHKHTNF